MWTVFPILSGLIVLKYHSVFFAVEGALNNRVGAFSEYRENYR